MKEKISKNKVDEMIDSWVKEILSDPEIASQGIDEEEIRRQLRERLLDKFQSGISLEAEEIKKRLRIRPKVTSKKEDVVEEEEMVRRFSIHFIIQHMIMFTSVFILILTGLPLKFPGFLGGIISVLGGIETSRVLHRVGATGLIIVGVYHIFYSIFHKEGRRDFFLLLPGKKDALDFFHMIKYFLGKAEEKPKFGRFSYVEKFDYWAVYWGCIILIGSGLPLWFENLSLRLLPKFILDIAKEAHSDEALLAALAIIVWHFYNVHFNPSRFPGVMTWWTGKISKKEMHEEHYLDYIEHFDEKDEGGKEDLKDLDKDNEKVI